MFEQEERRPKEDLSCSGLREFTVDEELRVGSN